MIRKNIKSKKTCQGLSFVLSVLEKIIFVFLCHAKNSNQTLFVYVKLIHHFHRTFENVFVHQLCISPGEKSSKELDKTLDKTHFNDKILIISFLLDIQHKTRQTASAFNVKTPKTTNVNIDKSMYFFLILL